MIQRRRGPGSPGDGSASCVPRPPPRPGSAQGTPVFWSAEGAREAEALLFGLCFISPVLTREAARRGLQSTAPAPRPARQAAPAAVRPRGDRRPVRGADLARAPPARRAGPASACGGFCRCRPAARLTPPALRAGHRVCAALLSRAEGGPALRPRGLTSAQTAPRLPGVEPPGRAGCVRGPGGPTAAAVPALGAAEPGAPTVYAPCAAVSPRPEGGEDPPSLPLASSAASSLEQRQFKALVHF